MDTVWILLDEGIGGEEEDHNWSDIVGLSEDSAELLSLIPEGWLELEESVWMEQKETLLFANVVPRFSLRQYAVPSDKTPLAERHFWDPSW